MRAILRVHAQKDSHGVRAFLVLADVLQVKRLARLRLLAPRLLGIGDKILALLLLGQRFEEIDDRLQLRRIGGLGVPARLVVRGSFCSYGA